MDPYILRSLSHSQIIKRTVWLRNATHQLVALTRPDIVIHESDKSIIRDTVEKYTNVKNRKSITLHTNYEFYQDAALNMFLIAANRFLELHDMTQMQLPANCNDIISLYENLWTQYWFKYDQNIAIQNILMDLYMTACKISSYVVVDPFVSNEIYNPYACKCCILGTAYIGIGRFENICNPNEVDYQETFTKSLNINTDTGFCHHICTEEFAPGQRYERAILNSHRVISNTLTET